MTSPGLRRLGRVGAALAAIAAKGVGLALHRIGVGRGGPAAGATDGELSAEVGRRYGRMKRFLFRGQPEISVAEWLARPTERPAVLVDVRELHERRVSMLPGAIAKQDFERNSARYRSWLVVPYCTIGLRSGLYTRELRCRGFEVRNLAGSALAWAHAGLPFEARGKATRRVHVFNADWNLLPEGYEAVVSDVQQS
jgi:rhodanese-related sulfurtransferase